MEKLRKMKKPIVPFGVIKAINEGKYNGKLFDNNTDLIDPKAKVGDYHYSVTTADSILHFITYTKTGLKRYKMPLAKFDWRLLWNKLDTIPLTKDDELVKSFEHFAEGTDIDDVCRWFEWMFEITLINEFAKSK